MAKAGIPLDRKIEMAQEKVVKTKEKYEAAITRNSNSLWTKEMP